MKLLIISAIAILPTLAEANVRLACDCFVATNENPHIQYMGEVVVEEENAPLAEVSAQSACANKPAVKAEGGAKQSILECVEI